MPATLTLEQVRTNEPDGFKVANEISVSEDIPTQLFVYRQIDDGFSHVAVLNDLEYPTENTPGVSYYRKNTAVREFTSATQALEFANHVKFRLDKLVEIYNEEGLAAFVGSDTTQIPLV